MKKVDKSSSAGTTVQQSTEADVYSVSQPIAKPDVGGSFLSTDKNKTVTRQERLAELKVQEQFYKVLDKYFDAGWKNWVKGIQQQNDVSNVRMFKILSELKGNDFVADLIKLMGKHNKHAYLELTKKPKGILLKDSRFKNISELIIDKYPSGSYREGKVFVQVKPDRWVGFVF